MDLETAKRFLLLASAGIGFSIAGAAHAQTTGQIGQEADRPGQVGPAGPAGEATQSGPEGRAAPAGASVPSGAAGIADIVVTAERRSSSVQRTAASVSVRTGDELRKEGKFLLREILENVPGVVGGAPEGIPATPGGTDEVGVGITIRGLSSNRGVGGGVTSIPAAVAVYTDDIYEGIGGTYDIDRVEVLRGPQGTLYGRSATGGVVAVHTRDPDLSNWGGLGVAELGDYNLRHFSAAVNAPLVDDKLAVRVAGDYYHRDGYESDTGLGLTVSKNLRIKLLAKPTDTLSILVGGALQDNETGSGGRTPALDAAGNRYVKPGPIGFGVNRFRQAWANIQWDLGFASLTYIPAYRSWYQNTVNVANAGPLTINQPLVTPKDDFLTNEVRLNSNGRSRLKWLVGVLQYYNSLANHVSLTLQPINMFAFASAVSKQTKALGFFGEATYSLSDAWRVTGGLRYDITRVAIDEDYTGRTGTVLSLSGDAGRRTFNDFTYKLRTEYDLSPRNLVYLSYSTGFSPGDVGATNDINGQPIVLALQDETLKALEIGSKNRFLDNKLQANASLFYYWFSGYQNQGIDVDPGPLISFAALVAPQHSYGGEAELVYQPDQADRLALNLAYVHARYVDRSDIFKQNIANPSTAGVPPFTANLSYSHRFDFAGGSSFDAVVDGRYLSPHDGGTLSALQIVQGKSGLIHVGGVAILNLSGTWTSPDRKFSLGAYIRNVSNERYALYSAVDSSSAGANLSLYQPRTFGAIGTLNF